MFSWIVDCPFCLTLEEGQSPGWNSLFPDADSSDVLWRGLHYYVVLDTAPIVPGHLLVVPNDHVTSLSQRSEAGDNELVRVKALVLNTLSNAYDAPTFVEHGSAGFSHTAGACVEHAHLHAIPGDYPLYNTFARDRLPVHSYSSQFKALQDFVSRPYMYCETPNGSVICAEAATCATQYLRRQIAMMSGHSERWNWRDTTRLAPVLGIRDEVRSAKERLQSLFERDPA